MQVIVDGQRDFALQGEPRDVLSAIAAINDFLREQGRAILSIEVDGKGVDAGSLVDAFENKPLSDFNELRIASEEITQLVKQCLREVSDALPELPKACHQLAEIFQGDEPQEGFEPFRHLADIWGSIKSREVMIINALRLDTNALKVGAKSVADHHKELNRFLQECAGALEKGDCVLLGDLLEYELAPRAENEAEIVAKLSEECAKQSS